MLGLQPFTFECFLSSVGNLIWITHNNPFFFFLFFISAYIFGRSRKLKNDVIEAINMLIEDVNICYELIAEQAVEHIHHK